LYFNLLSDRQCKVIPTILLYFCIIIGAKTVCYSTIILTAAPN